MNNSLTYIYALLNQNKHIFQFGLIALSATSNAEPDPNYYYGGPGYYHGYYSPGFKQYPSYYHNQVDTSNLYTFTGPATAGMSLNPK